MTTRVIVRGDSYALRRPFYELEFVTSSGQPFDLAGCVVRTTYKATVTTPADDPSDETAAIKHYIAIDAAGVPTTENGLYLVGEATGGVLEEHLTDTESLGLPLNVELLSDVELIDANDEVFTWKMLETVKTEDGLTHRRTLGV